MMKLSTMQAIVATLSDRGESPIAQAIVSAWEHDPGTVRFLRASTNFLFLFQHAGQEFVLRFIHASERNPAAIAGELAYLQHLANNGVRVATPVRSRASHLLETVATEQGEFHAVVLKRLAGEQFELADLTPAMAAQWGQALGKLHAAAQGYSGAGRPTWKDHLALLDASLPHSEAAARSMLDLIDERLSHLPIDRDRFGLIHFDFELDNIIWGEHGIGIVDFDDCARYWFVADIAFALRDAFDDSAENVNVQNGIARQFIDGYRTVRSIEDEELKLIPLFLRLHNLFMFVKLQHALGHAEPTHEPAWVAALRQKLQAKMGYYRAEFSKALD